MKVQNKLEIQDTLKVGVLPNATTSNFSVLFNDGGDVKKRTVGSIINKNEGDYLPSVSNLFPDIFNFNNSTTFSTPNLTVSLKNQLKNTVFAAPTNLNGTPSFRFLENSDLENTTVSYQGHLHQIGDINGLNSSLDSKANAGGNNITNIGTWQSNLNVLTTNTSQTGLTGNKTTSGIWYFSGTNATPLRLERTSGVNTTIEYINSGISIFTGSTDGNAWAIGSSVDLNYIPDRWMWADNTGRIFSKTDGNSSQWNQAYLNIANVNGELNNIYDQLSAKANTRLSNVVSDLSAVEKTAIKTKLGISESDVSNAVMKNEANEISDEFRLVNGGAEYRFYDNSFGFNYNNNALSLNSDELEFDNNGVITRFSTNLIQFNQAKLNANPYQETNVNIPITGATERTLATAVRYNGVSKFATDNGVIDLGELIVEEDLSGFVYDVTYTSDTHILTFFRKNQPNIVIDLPIEQLIKGVEVIGDDLVFTFEDGTTTIVPMNTLLVGVVKKVNGIVPNSQGEIVLNISDIPGLSSELNKIGALSTLTTTNKNNLVDAINEVNVNSVQLESIYRRVSLLSVFNYTGVIRLNLGNKISGYLKVGITGSWNAGNTNGYIGIEGGVIAGSVINYNSLRCVSSIGMTRSAYYIDPVIKRDSVSGQLYLEIHRKQSGESRFNVNIEYLALSNITSTSFNPTLSSVYTGTDVSSLINEITIDGNINTANFGSASHWNQAYLNIANVNGELNNIYDQLSAKANTRLSNVVSDLSATEKTAIKTKLGISESDASNAVKKNTINEITTDFALKIGSTILSLQEGYFGITLPNSEYIGFSSSNGIEIYKEDGSNVVLGQGYLVFNQAKLNANPQQETNLNLPISGSTDRYLATSIKHERGIAYADESGLIDLGLTNSISKVDIHISQDFQNILNNISDVGLEWGVSYRRGKTLGISIAIYNNNPNNSIEILPHGTVGFNLMTLDSQILQRCNSNITELVPTLKLIHNDFLFNINNGDTYLDLGDGRISHTGSLTVGGNSKLIITGELECLDI